MEMKIPAIAITAVVVVIVLAGVLMPVLNDATATRNTFVNDGYFRMTEITEDTDVMVMWDHTKPNSVFVDDTEYPINVEVSRLTTIVGTDSMIVRFVSSTDGSATRVQVYSSAGFIQASVANATDLRVAITSSSVSATVGESTKTVGITTGFYVDPEGSWTMKKANDDAYLHKTDSVMIFSGVTNIGVDVGVYGAGTIESGMEINNVPTSSVALDVSFGDVTFNYNDVSGYVDLVSLSDCTFNITVAEPANTGTATYSYFIVPYEVSAEKAVHFNDNQNAIFAAIPIMVIIALLIAVVAMVFRSRQF